jgi:hypothetical protein
VTHQPRRKNSWHSAMPFLARGEIKVDLTMVIATGSTKISNVSMKRQYYQVLVVPGSCTMYYIVLWVYSLSLSLQKTTKGQESKLSFSRIARTAYTSKHDVILTQFTVSKEYVYCKQWYVTLTPFRACRTHTTQHYWIHRLCISHSLLLLHYWSNVHTVLELYFSVHWM